MRCFKKARVMGLLAKFLSAGDGVGADKSCGQYAVNHASASTCLLLGVVLWLRLSVRAVKEKRHDLLEWLFADVDGAVDALARLHPIHFANRHLPRLSFATVAEFDIQHVAA